MSHESSFTLACDGANCGTILVFRSTPQAPIKLPTLRQAEALAKMRHRWAVSKGKHYCEVCAIIRREHPEVGRGRR